MPIEVISLDFKNITNLFIAKTLSKINQKHRLCSNYRQVLITSTTSYLKGYEKVSYRKTSKNQ